MREVFHGQLARLGRQLASMCTYSGQAMRTASAALLTADLALAERVLVGDDGLDEQRSRCEEHAQALLALQAPVAHDLRQVLAVVYSAERIERMGDLAALVADVARFAHPARAVPAELETVFAELGMVTSGMADRVAELIMAPAKGCFVELERTDHDVDTLHAQILDQITSPDWPHAPAVAAQLALLARFYERFGDHAVSVARRLEFTETGNLPL